jgi:hypothetical protein
VPAGLVALLLEPGQLENVASMFSSLATQPLKETLESHQGAPEGRPRFGIEFSSENTSCVVVRRTGVSIRSLLSPRPAQRMDLPREMILGRVRLATGQMAPLLRAARTYLAWTALDDPSSCRRSVGGRVEPGSLALWSRFPGRWPDRRLPKSPMAAAARDPVRSGAFHVQIRGEPGETRTLNQLIKSQLLCH